MKISTMTGREQLLVLISAAIFLGGAYGMLRYRPALKSLAEMQLQTNKTEERLKTTIIPDAPDEDEESIRERMLEAEEKLAAAQTQLAELEMNLPPTDAQEVKLKISELAQASRLLVRENLAYKIGDATIAPTFAGSSTRKSRRAARAAVKTAAAAPKLDASAVAYTPGIGLEMLDRYANPDFSRPLQRLSLEGYYTDIRYFLDELQKLPWQVTVAQMQIETDLRQTEPGMPQPLRATLILAL